MAQNKPSGAEQRIPPGFRTFGGFFTFRLLPTVIAAVLIAALIGLGTWQIERLHWKEGLIAEIAQRMKEPAFDIGLSSFAEDDIDNKDYRHAQASGLLQNDKELFLNSISLKGEGGYHVLTPLLLDDGRSVLIDRGWIPYAKKDPRTRPEGQLAGPTTISGIVHVPAARRPGFRPDNHSEKNDWYWIDLKAMSKTEGLESFLPYVLEADDSYNRGGYPVGGQTRIELPNNHLSYAITWYALAFALLVVYLISSWRKKGPVKVKSSAEEASEAT